MEKAETASTDFFILLLDSYFGFTGASVTLREASL
ncbi:MAG: hypothetical protein QOJ02_4123 [Acidobacteriota bacterium]|nr:hypothetical protein [Acidobacteriota bacterium]